MMRVRNEPMYDFGFLLPLEFTSTSQMKRLSTVGMVGPTSFRIKSLPLFPIAVRCIARGLQIGKP